MTGAIDPVPHNRAAWDRQVDAGQRVDPPGRAGGHRAGPGRRLVGRPDRLHADARATGSRPTWPGLDVLCLASGGGQQGPVLAAAGATVTVLDNSPRQLERDAEVAARDGLALRTVLGDMRDLSAFADASFDLVFHPVSNVFCPDLAPVWRGVLPGAAAGRDAAVRVHEPGRVHLRHGGPGTAGARGARTASRSTRCRCRRPSGRASSGWRTRSSTATR